jgi:hypothetical protein
MSLLCCCPTDDGSISTIEPMTKKLQLLPNIYGCPKKLVNKLGDWKFLVVTRKGLITKSSDELF